MSVQAPPKRPAPDTARAPLPDGPRGGLRRLAEFRRDRLRFLERCAREWGDFVPIRSARRLWIVINHPSLIEELFVTQNRAMRKPKALGLAEMVLGEGVLLSEGELWHRQRRTMQPAFHQQHIEACVAEMAGATERMLRRWRDGQRLDIRAESGRLMLEIVAKALFGADVSADAEQLESEFAAIAAIFSERMNWPPMAFLSRLPTPKNRLVLRAVAHLDEVIDRIVRGRQDSGPEHRDLLSILLAAKAEQGSPITGKLLRDEIATMLVAGHESSADALGWTVYLLAQHPEAETRIKAEAKTVLGGRPATAADVPKLDYTNMVVKESLRLYPPGWAFGRTLVENSQLGGFAVPKGAFVFASPWVVHRDARWYADPLAFKPERWASDESARLPKFAFFPFGGGQRMCIGHAFAITELAVVLATIVPRFHLSLVPDHPVVPLPTNTLRPRYGIHVVAQSREAR